MSHCFIRRLYALLLLAGLFLIDAQAHAQYQAGDPINDRVSLDVGAYLLGTSTNIQVNGTLNSPGLPIPIGTPFNVERDLGYRNTDRLRFDGYWRFFKRHKLTVTYFDTSRDSSRSLERTLQFGNVTFPVGVEVNSHFSTQVAEVAYEYGFFRTRNFELSGSLGIHNMKVDLDLAGTGILRGVTRDQATSASADGPLPVIGLHAVWSLSRHFYLDGEGQLFKVSISPYNGSLQDYTGSVVWQMFRHFGIGAGYDEFISHAGVNSDTFHGDLRWSYGGARLYFRGSF